MKVTTPEEGRLIVEIEDQTPQIPSGVYVSASLTAFIASFILKKQGKNVASFLVQCMLPVLILGIYSRIAKITPCKKATGQE